MRCCQISQDNPQQKVFKSPVKLPDVLSRRKTRFSLLSFKLKLIRENMCGRLKMHAKKHLTRGLTF